MQEDVAHLIIETISMDAQDAGVFKLVFAIFGTDTCHLSFMTSDSNGPPLIDGIVTNCQNLLIAEGIIDTQVEGEVFDVDKTIPSGAVIIYRAKDYPKTGLTILDAVRNGKH